MRRTALTCVLALASAARADTFDLAGATLDGDNPYTFIDDALGLVTLTYSGNFKNEGLVTNWGSTTTIGLGERGTGSGVLNVSWETAITSLDVRAYDLAARKLVWKAETGGDTDCSPLIVGDRLFIGAEEGKPNYHCFDRKTGKELWSMNMPSGCWSTAAAWNDTIIVGGNNGKLYCLDQATGKEKWVYKSGAGIWSSPSVVDGKALFGSYDRYYRMVDAETGEELWKYDMGDRSHSGAAVEDGHIWVGSASGWFYCFG